MPGRRSGSLRTPPAVYRRLNKSATLDEIRAHGHVLTPGRYVGAEAAEDDGESFEKKIARLTRQLHDQMDKGQRLDDVIAGNLKELGYPLSDDRA